MERAHASLASVGCGERLLPPRTGKVETAEAERDLGAPLAIALAGLALLDARTSVGGGRRREEGGGEGEGGKKVDKSKK